MAINFPDNSFKVNVLNNAIRRLYALPFQIDQITNVKIDEKICLAFNSTKIRNHHLVTLMDIRHGAKAGEHDIACESNAQPT